MAIKDGLRHRLRSLSECFWAREVGGDLMNFKGAKKSKFELLSVRDGSGGAHTGTVDDACYL